MAPLTISQLADSAGVNLETVRYYERRGLLREPPRTPAGYRQYSEADLWRLQFIARAKLLNFTLSEISRLLAGPEEPAAAVLGTARAKLAEVRQRQLELARTVERLERLVQACQGGASDGCTDLRAAN
jgi:DNA-binding transcriptional MerR regulator